MNPIQKEHYFFAIDSQRRISFNFLNQLLNSNQTLIQQNLVPELLWLHDSLFNHLRSKVFPERSIEQFTQDLFHGLVSRSKVLEFFCVLSDSTALKEVNYFINFVNLYKNFESSIKINFVFTYWPIVDHNCQVVSKPTSLMDRLEQINQLLQNNVGCFDLYLASPEEGYFANADPLFFKEFQQINDQVCHCRKEAEYDSSLMNDIQWITSFYQRQHSLCQFAPNQAIYDLCVRRALGAYVARKYETLKGGTYNDRAYFLITSELNKRFLKCYNAQSPILNISIS